MSSPGIDISQLSHSEKAALETYTAVTSQEPAEAIPLLRRSEWNVQVGYEIPSNEKIGFADKCSNRLPYPSSLMARDRIPLKKPVLLLKALLDKPAEPKIL